MDSAEEARRKEARDNWKMLPAAIILTFGWCGAFVIIVAREIEIFGHVYYGFAKTLWFLNASFLGGIALILGIFSLSLLITIGLVAINLKTKAHPWLPLIRSVKVLVIGVIFLYAAMRINSLINENIDIINAWHAHFNRDFSILSFIIDLIITGICSVIAALSLSIAIQVLLMPFSSSKIAKEISTQR
ncbi:hypothetical protein [Pseudoteredinibacter isoporae]|uniref:Uncharacterized protein n=1 Tax=Pseudoteredinibacter isoporae TaxID=570281 RepID=A0A7X0MX82_9GAMM|nr:hypothetical protein [Pseudoteredinibacter isoporae]MBB6521779.1 hypothetical protein [Pseudoteredinibacter isoporae]NHO87326.1 hypothetical protein [Pseudoteredinibacter isoporae]NIB23042.1 hypothetical protein [Pseudoteredinibacter isoporae]